MRLITFDRAFLYAQGVKVPAGMRVVVPDVAGRAAYHMSEHEKLTLRVSGIGQYLRPYCGQDLTGRRLVCWRGCGIGDQLMWSGLLAYLAHRFPTAEIVNFLHPMLLSLWPPRTWALWRTRTEPIPFDSAWVKADYHLIGESLNECDSEPDQPNAYDALFERAGFDPDTIPALYKRPHFCLSPHAIAQATAVIGGVAPEPPPGEHCPPGPPDRGAAPALAGQRVLTSQPEPAASTGAARAIEGSGESTTPRRGVGQRPAPILWQVSSANSARAYPPGPTRRALRLLCAAFPGRAIIVFGRAQDLRHHRPFPVLPNLRVVTGQSLNTCLAMIAQSALLVCPDSCCGHAAAAFPSVPVLSLWGPFAPADRVTYYANHHPLVGAQPCAPCRWHWTHRCPRVKRGIGWCHALASIPPERILQTAKGLLHHE